MKFTLNLNMLLTALVIAVVAGINIYNQVITPPGTINLQQLIGEITGPGVLMVLNYLGHSRNPDGTSARVAYDPSRDQQSPQ